MAFPSYAIYNTKTESGQGSSRTTAKIVNPTGTKYSEKMTPNEYGDLGFTLITTGTLSGTFTLWYSDKENPDVSTDGDWTQDPTWAPTNPAGAATNVAYNVSGLRKKWARVKYVHSAGAGDLSGFANY